jgi:DNA-binding Xre family transcriptional regulator
MIITASEMPRRATRARHARVADEDWAAVAAALNARMARDRVTQTELAHRADLSVATLRSLQHATGRRATDATLAAVCRALGWPDQHLLHVLLGETPPTPVDQPPPAPLPRESANATAREIVAILRRMESDIETIAERLSQGRNPIPAR